jgi:hypothetical protein
LCGVSGGVGGSRAGGASSNGAAKSKLAEAFGLLGHAAKVGVDAAKGIEPQTLKLFEVCRLRDIPIVTFINKMDREAQDPIELLDEVASTLALDVSPMTWPTGSGQNFKGTYDLNNNRMLVFDNTDRSRIGEVIDMCQPIRDAAASGADAGTPQFMARWAEMGQKLLDLAGEDEAKGRMFSASNKLERASLYLFTAERMQGHGHPGRKETYAKARAAFDKSTQLGAINRERVEVPLANGTMPALFTRAPGEGRKPVVVFCNGLDSCKELLYWTKLPQELARRGISTLCVDQPGSGEALRLHIPDQPVWAQLEAVRAK